ncbi:MAG: TIGR00282 family metallophosphoesterase [Pseudomonadota bacterium]
MNLLFLGDIVGSPGREALARYLPRLKDSLNLDFVVINGENAAHGFGITAQICHEFYELGVDCITTGNHVWDQREIKSYIEKDPQLIRPVNYPAGAPGRGYTIVENDKGKKLCVINVMTRLFMDPLDDPFGAVEKVLAEVQLGVTVDAIMVDVHGEASSEKMGMGHFCDGFVSLVVGTHTHVPTADAQILSGGTAYQTDAGMCGCYDSIIGMDKDISLNKMIDKVPGERMHPAYGEGTICGIFVEIDDDTGLARAVEPVRMGPQLLQARP